MGIRRAAALMLGCLLVVVALSPARATVAPEGSAARAATTALTVKLADASLVHGQTAVLKGKLTSGARPVRRGTVSVQRRLVGTTTWVKVTTVRTSRRGTWKASLRDQTAHASFRAVFAGARRVRKATSRTTELSVAAPLRDEVVTPGGPRTQQGVTWAWRASTLPDLQGTTVRLLRRPDGEPAETVATTTVGAQGAIALDHVMTQPGWAFYTLVVDATPRLGEARGDAAYVDVRASTPPLTITTSTLPDASQGTPYDQLLSASGGSGTRTWTWTTTTAPPGLSLSSSGRITGTPTTLGTSTVTVTVTDTRGSVSRDLTIRVSAPPLALTTTALPDAFVGDAYAGQLTVTGGRGPYTFGADFFFPPFLTMHPDGRITGTPPEGDNVRGVWQFIVGVRDADGTEDEVELTIEVYGDPDVPLVLSRPDGSLGDGRAGDQYWSIVKVDDPPVGDWQITAGALPPGTHLDERGDKVEIEGTTTTPGTYSFDLTAVDGPRRVTGHYTILVLDASEDFLDCVPPFELPDARVGQPYQHQLQANTDLPVTWTGLDLYPWLTLSPSGVLSGTPDHDWGGVAFAQRVGLTDGRRRSECYFYLRIQQ